MQLCGAMRICTIDLGKYAYQWHYTTAEIRVAWGEHLEYYSVPTLRRGSNIPRRSPGLIQKSLQLQDYKLKHIISRWRSSQTLSRLTECLEEPTISFGVGIISIWTG